MRLSILAISFATAAAATLAVMACPTAGHAQSNYGDWNPNFPVCLEVYGFDGGYRECAYTSMASCQASASGRPAGCVVNGYYAGGYADEPEVTIYRHHRRHRRHS